MIYHIGDIQRKLKMREFYFEDQNKKVAYRGVLPHDDVNCRPLDYFKYGCALFLSNKYRKQMEMKGINFYSDDLINKVAIQNIDKQISEMLGNSNRNDNLLKLLSNDGLSYKEQNRLLKGMVLTSKELLWLDKDAQDLNYMLDVFQEEKYPEKFNFKNTPVCFYQQNDNSVETIGKTDMTDGEMRALLEQRKVVQARVFHKGEHWHCFYYTFKGLAGLEPGILGKIPHYHYISDKSGITRVKLEQCIKECNMPTSKVHIVLDRAL